MRRWLVIVLIALLPWRAWAADAMTLAMAAPSDADLHCVESLLQPQAAAQDLHGDDLAGPDAAAPHAVCDSCNGAALGVTLARALDTGPRPQARLDRAPVRFVSAPPRTGFKPPIG